MIEITNELIATFSGLILTVLGLIKTWIDKKDLIAISDPESDTFQIPKTVKRQNYIVNDETRNFILSTLPASEKIAVNDLIDSKNEYILKSGDTVEYWIHTSKGSYFINWEGYIAKGIGTNDDYESSPIKPSGYVLPTNGTINSGEAYSYEIFFNPDSGVDRVTRIYVEFGDGAENMYDIVPGQKSLIVQHVYEYKSDGKYTGKTYFPKFVLYGARNEQKSMEKIVSVVVNDPYVTL